MEKTMSQRLNLFQVAPEAIAALLKTQAYVNESGLEHSLLELVKMRASQINAWRESDLYTPRERAALGWTEALTRLSEAAPNDDAFAELRAHFSEKECVDLSMSIAAINAWNRLNAGFRSRHPADRARKTDAAA
jgi:alkylhydroperoxidase family enzyme